VARIVAQNCFSVLLLWDKVGGKGFGVSRPSSPPMNLIKHTVLGISLDKIGVVQRVRTSSYISVKAKIVSSLLDVLDIKFTPGQFSIYVEEHLSRFCDAVEGLSMLETTA
jgi:hypothetical protein